MIVSMVYCIVDDDGNGTVDDDGDWDHIDDGLVVGTGNGDGQ